MNIEHSSSVATAARVRQVRIVVADHEPVRAEGIRTILGLAYPTVTVLRLVHEREAMLEAVELEAPDLVVVGHDETEMNALDVLDVLSVNGRPISNVVLLVDEQDRSICAAAMRAGVGACLPRSTPAEEICAAVVACGLVGTVIPRRRGLDGLTPNTKVRLLPTLTPRETEVLQLLASDMRPCEIAKQLVVHETTVRTHLASIYQKWDVRGAAGAIAEGLRSRVIQ